MGEVSRDQNEANPRATALLFRPNWMDCFKRLGQTAMKRGEKQVAAGESNMNYCSIYINFSLIYADGREIYVNRSVIYVFFSLIYINRRGKYVFRARYR